MADKQTDYSDLEGKACVLTVKGGKPANVVVQEVNETHVACQFEGGGVLYVTREDIVSLEAGKSEPEGKERAHAHAHEAKED